MSVEITPPEAVVANAVRLIDLGVVTHTDLGQGSTDDNQTVTVTGAPTGGTFDLAWNGHVAAGIAFDATAGDIANALAAAVPNADIINNSGAVEFGGTLGGAPQPLITLSANHLAGGAAPSVSIVHIVVGRAIVLKTLPLAMTPGMVVYDLFADPASVVEWDGAFGSGLRIGQDVVPSEPGPASDWIQIGTGAGGTLILYAGSYALAGALPRVPPLLVTTTHPFEIGLENTGNSTITAGSLHLYALVATP